MKVVQARRISQIFFFTLFVWLIFVGTVGDKFWQIRAWPVNLFLNLDPLVAIGTIFTTHKLYYPLLWALVTVVLTIIVGRFFCSFICPFGTLHHFAGFLAHRNKKVPQKIQLNKYRSAQSIKYFILAFFLGAAAFPSISNSLQTGLLDPIPLISRSFSTVILPIANSGKFYEGAGLIFTVFAAVVLLNLAIPRFYCRFICPLGALFGILGRFAIWRIGKNTNQCSNCKLCERACEGGCEPAQKIRISECVLCLNCKDDCHDQVISYQTNKSLAGEITNPDISRRGFVLSLAGGVFAIPAVRLSNKLGPNWFYKIIRPPGAIEEKEFLKRCIKCGQCMRICPTNIIQPAGFEGGIENLWTPVLNYRIGSSGCHLNCVACGQVCPTAAIRPIKLNEKRGFGEFSQYGPIKLGTAFVDQNRCLPWAMNKPCIVCEENCPVSPKAIYTQEHFNTVRDGVFIIKNSSGTTIETVEKITGNFASGDYYCFTQAGQRSKIAAHTQTTIELANDSKNNKMPSAGEKIKIQVRLQRPVIDIEKCIGCGICEHECPVSGLKAIRVSAEGETRSKDRRILPGG